MLELKIGINIITNHVNGSPAMVPAESPGKAVLSAICGARLPLPSQEVFGFEVKHVSVCLSLLALAVHVFLGFLHHLLRLLRHLMNKRTKPAVSLQNEGFTSCHLLHFEPQTSYCMQSTPSCDSTVTNESKKKPSKKIKITLDAF